MAEGVLNLTDQSFETTIKTSSLPVLVDFWAEWCGPCRRVGPIIEEIAKEYAGKLIVAKVDIDANQEVTIKNNIQSIPTLVIYKNGQMAERMIGALPKDALVENIQRFI